MSRASRIGLAGIGSLGAAGILYSGPTVVGLSSVGVRVAPTLVGHGRHDHVALTFDDGPDPDSTPAFLDMLEELGWSATFFMLGEMARRAPSLVAATARAGHEVAVHGDRHRSMLYRTPVAVRDDIRRCRDTLAELSGAEPKWFRPPYGMLTVAAAHRARLAGLTPVLWTHWGRDWRRRATAASVANDVIGRNLPGATVLLHDSDCHSAPGSWRTTLAALPRLADEFARQGLTVGPLRDHGIPPSKWRRPISGAA